MSQARGTYLSPILLFVIGITLFELCLRLPYVLYVRFTPELGYLAGLHFFSSYDADRVIFIGLAVLLTTFVFCAFIAMRMRMSYNVRSINFPHFDIPWIIYPIALVFIGASFLSIVLLGIGNVTENLSGKRSEIGEDALLYISVKMSNFCHIIAVLFYVKILMRRRFVDMVFFALAVVALILPTIVFSQRAILIGFALEMLYVQMIFRTFNFRGMLRILAIIIPVLLLISFLRPGNSAADVSFLEGLMTALEKVVSSRYFFDFAKLGTVIAWSMETDWLGPISLTFLVEPFAPDSFYFYKEVGPLISAEAYSYRIKHGVTPGALLEAVLSFGVLGGVLFFGGLVAAIFKIEKRMLVGKPRQTTFWFLLHLLILSKFSLLVNSSLGAFAFQTVLETGFLIGVFLAFSFWRALVGSQRRLAY